MLLQIRQFKHLLYVGACYFHRNIKLQERYGRLPDSTAYDTVMGSKRFTKSSLAQMRNPDLVINLIKEKRNNKNSDVQVVIHDCALVP